MKIGKTRPEGSPLRASASPGASLPPIQLAAEPPGIRSDVELTLVRTAAEVSMAKQRRAEDMGAVIDLTTDTADKTLVRRAIAKLPDHFDASVFALKGYVAATSVGPARAGKEIMESLLALLVSVKGDKINAARDASLRLTAKLIESNVVFSMHQLETVPKSSFNFDPSLDFIFYFLTVCVAVPS